MIAYIIYLCVCVCVCVCVFFVTAWFGGDIFKTKWVNLELIKYVNITTYLYNNQHYGSKANNSGGCVFLSITQHPEWEENGMTKDCANTKGNEDQGVPYIEIIGNHYEFGIFFFIIK